MQNRFFHNLGISDSELEKFVNNLSEDDFFTLIAMLDSTGGSDGVFAFYIFHKNGEEKAEQILRALGWANVDLISLMYRVNDQSLSDTEGRRITFSKANDMHWGNVFANQNLMSSFAYAKLGNAIANRLDLVEGHPIRDGVDRVKKLFKSKEDAVKSIGEAFDPKGNKVQIGVDPRTITPGKDLTTLDPIRQQNAIKYGGDHPIIVDSSGKVLDGNHRLNDALQNNRSIDIQIGY